MKKRILSAAAASALLLTGCGADKKSSYDPPEYIEPYEVVAVESEFDMEENRQWFNEFCEGLLTYSTHVEVSGKIDKRAIKAGMRQLNTDCPDVFWIGVYYYDHMGGKTNIDFEPIDGMSEEDIQPMHEELVKAADELIDSIPEGLDEYGTALYVHDYIADNCEYDYAGLRTNDDHIMYTAYGALVRGKAVCQGYAEAYTYIMKRLGFEVGTVQGDTYSFVGHAWNYIKINGKYYWVDVTWDDQTKKYPTSHTYFLFNDEMQAQTRYLDWDQNFGPVCDSLDDNYSVKNGLYFDKYDRDTIEETIKDWDEDFIELRFADFDSYKEALDDLIGKNKIVKVAGSGSSFYRDDRSYVLTVYLK